MVTIAEEILVAGVEVMLPKVLSEPRAAVWPHSPKRSVYWTCHAPNVGVVVSHPTVCVIEGLRGLGAGYGEFVDEMEQRLVTFGEVRNF